MTTREFLELVADACKKDKRFDAIEGVGEVRTTTLAVFPFDGPALILHVKQVR